MRKISVFLICMTFLLFTALSFVWAIDPPAARLIIPVTKFTSADLPDGAPAGWSVDKNTGNPSIRMEKDGNIFFLHLFSLGDSSFGVRKEVKVDVKKFPILSWRWKANKLPKGGDVRKSSTDDQALQVYVAFKPISFPAMTNTPVIGYVWDNEAPKGWTGRSTQIGGGKLRYIVLRNRTDKTGQWYTEHRNIYQDYKMLFKDIYGGEPHGLTTGLQVHINSQKTKSPAEGLIGEMYFSNSPSDIAMAESVREVKETPDVKISAVKPPPSPKISAVKKHLPADCINISIEFSPESTDIGNNHNDDMREIVKYLIKNPEAKLTIVGHTDSTGSKQHNLILSKKRATSVKNYLVNSFNIDPQRLNTQGAGAAQPVADSDTKEGHNNRVTINDCP